MGTIFISGVLIIVVSSIIFSMIKKNRNAKKTGKCCCSCCGGCSGCHKTH